MTFSQRKGLKPVRDLIQRDSMDAALRNSLWNCLTVYLWENDSFLRGQRGNLGVRNLGKMIWAAYFKLPMDTLPAFDDFILPELRKHFLGCGWNEVYDFLEFVLPRVNDPHLIEAINLALDREMSAYRFVGDVFTEITGEQEIVALEQALSDRDFPAVAAHLERALELLSDRENPDYRNSIKESISAVESIAKELTKKPAATLADALKDLGLEGKLHPALKDGFLKLYGYTSDEDGIRHAMLEEPNLSAEDAMYWLLSCTAFVNYLKTKA